MGGGLSQCYTQPAGGGGREQAVWGGGVSQCYTQPAGGGGREQAVCGASQCYTQPAGVARVGCMGGG